MIQFSESERFTRIEARGDLLAQVLTFAAPGILEEVRMLFYCDNPPEVIAASIRAVGSNGEPLEEFLSPAGIVFQNKDPLASDQLHACVLSTPLTVREGDRVALTIGSAFDTCWIATNPSVSYPGGALFRGGEKVPGALVFQAMMAR